jgi:hypothetical protein
MVILITQVLLVEVYRNGKLLSSITSEGIIMCVCVCVCVCVCGQAANKTC